jgi:DNA-binding SARP family transcriptional activator
LSVELKVKLLGPPAAFPSDEPLNGFVSIKAQALLFYLAATGTLHRRDTLAALLWSNVPDAAAQKNLRDFLYDLRGLHGSGSNDTRTRAAVSPLFPTSASTFSRRS